MTFRAWFACSSGKNNSPQFLTTQKPALASGTALIIRPHSLAKWERFGIDHCDYLKLDCKGAEFESILLRDALTSK
jgi:hypothetical protein